MMSQPAQAETHSILEMAIGRSGGLLPAMHCSIVFRRSPIHESRGVRPLHIPGFDGIDLQPRSADQVVHLAIEMTTPAIRVQHGVNQYCQRAIRFSGDRPCSTKSKSPFENTPHLHERRDRIGDRAQRPRHYRRPRRRMGDVLPKLSSATPERPHPAFTRAPNVAVRARDRSRRRDQRPGRRTANSGPTRRRPQEPDLSPSRFVRWR
jgi:hypothetical protein